MASLPKRVPALVKAGAALASLWGIRLLLLVLYQRAVLFAWSQGWLDGSLGSVFRDAHIACYRALTLALDPLLFAATVAIPLALTARTVARARVRAGLSDPLDRLRDWTAAHPRAARLVAALPAAHWVAMTLAPIAWAIARWGGHWMYGTLASSPVIHQMRVAFATCTGAFGILASSAGGYVLYRASAIALRLFLAETVDPEESRGAVSDRRIGFDAVAVTAETRAAVAAMAALPFATFLLITLARLGDVGTVLALAAYVTAAIAGTVAFRRASRIAVGLDGIYVTGTSRSRFFAYSTLDRVRADGSDIELERRGHVVLRLQLHGADALQKDAIAERIGAAIRAATEKETAGVGDIVLSVSDDKLARLVQGGAEGYRSPSVSRAQLWSVVLGPEHDADTRAAAARALAVTGDHEERERLRVAASQSAEPRGRALLTEIAKARPPGSVEDEEEDEDDEEEGLRRKGMWSA